MVVGKALAASGRIGEALDLAGELPVDSGVSELLAMVASVQAKAGDTGSARATLLQGQEAALRLNNSERRWALLQLARTSLEAGDAELALELAAATDPSVVAEIRATQAIAQGRFHEALNEIEALDSEFKTADLLEQLIERALDADDMHTAWTALRRITVEYQVAKSVARIAEHASGRGEFVTAVETASQIADEGIRSRALGSIALAQAHAGQGAAAVRTTELIRTGQAEHLPAIAGALGEAGLREDLKRLLEASARSIPGAYAMCGVLATTYPDQAHPIAEVVVQLSPPGVFAGDAATGTRRSPASPTETGAVEKVIKPPGQLGGL